MTPRVEWNRFAKPVISVILLIASVMNSTGLPVESLVETMELHSSTMTRFYLLRELGGGSLPVPSLTSKNTSKCVTLNVLRQGRQAGTEAFLPWLLHTLFLLVLELPVQKLSV